MDDELYYQDDDESGYSDDLEPRPFWTVRRIILTIIVIITLIAFLAYSLQGLFFQPPPIPPTELPPMI
ncbi:MAG TPA: hypothetical protein VK003_17590 [Oceanobacillus sp.]|nr:hypothetical protein [Oceanobacillus sp.]